MVEAPGEECHARDEKGGEEKGRDDGGEESRRDVDAEPEQEADDGKEEETRGQVCGGERLWSETGNPKDREKREGRCEAVQHMNSFLGAALWVAAGAIT